MTAPRESFRAIMQEAGLSQRVIYDFEHYYDKLAKGEKGLLDNTQIKPPNASQLIDYHSLPHGDPNLLRQLAVIKLNGGLGTSMGLTKAKTLLPVKQNLTFLDIIARQIISLRQQSGCDVQLLFMNSYNTHEDTIDFLSKYPELPSKTLPLGFIQNKYPRIKQDDLRPFQSSQEEANWNPPGHGDLYNAITDSGILDSLLNMGIHYAFVSNADNLGAVVSDQILTYMHESGVPFLMEVCERTEIDKKGGHLAQDESGHLILREVAQCPDNEKGEFQDIKKYSFFNTNNLWINLKALRESMNKGFLLPLIVNPKIVGDTPVYQLESAMGAAINVFEGAQAIVVPRQRFAPVKKTSDLLLIWSDVFDINQNYQIVMNGSVPKLPVVLLDESYYSSITQLQHHFPDGAPSLRKCHLFNVEGDITFVGDVICKDAVEIKAQSPAVIKNQVVTGSIILK